jgi:predicted 2-oxoglutarate/Fe(II)-dependent dioxygenase YbiX
MINDKVSDYIFHTTFDSSITDITDQIFGEDINWQDHTWTDNYGKSVGSSSPTKVTYQHKLGIGDELYQALTNYIKEYFNYIDNDYFKVEALTALSEIRFNKYNSGSLMESHIDHIRSLFDGERKGIPILSIVGLLNDDFIGGEFILCGNEMKLKKNSLLIWPSNFMYPHRVAEIKEGTRYSFVAWLW